LRAQTREFNSIQNRAVFLAFTCDFCCAAGCGRSHNGAVAGESKGRWPSDRRNGQFYLDATTVVAVFDPTMVSSSINDRDVILSMHTHAYIIIIIMYIVPIYFIAVRVNKQTAAACSAALFLRPSSAKASGEVSRYHRRKTLKLNLVVGAHQFLPPVFRGRHSSTRYAVLNVAGSSPPTHYNTIIIIIRV